MPQIISGDPLSRYTFALEENGWDQFNNYNIRATAQQANKLQEAMVGSAAPHELNSLSGPPLTVQIENVDTTATDAASDAANALSLAGQKADQTALDTVVRSLAFGKLHGGGNPTVTEVPTGATLPQLSVGQRVIVYRPSTDTLFNLVLGAYGSGATSAYISFEPGEGDEPSFTRQEGDLVILHPNATQDALGLPEVKDRSLRNETAISGLHNRMGNVESRLYSIGEVASGISETRIVANAKAAALEASRVERVNDEPVMKLNESIDGVMRNTINVRWEKDEEVATGDLIILDQPGEENLLLRATSDASGEESTTTALGISDPDLGGSISITANTGADIYLTTSTLASRIAARTDGAVKVTGDVMKSATWGTHPEDDASGFPADDDDFRFLEPVPDPNPDNLTRLKRDENGTIVLPKRGWALTSSGEVGFTSAFMSGDLIASSLFLTGDMVISPPSVDDTPQIRSATGEFKIDANALQLQATDDAGRGGLNIDFAYSSNSIKESVGRIFGDASGNSRDFVLMNPSNPGPGTSSNLTVRSTGSVKVKASGLDNTAGNIALETGGAGSIFFNTQRVRVGGLPVGPDEDGVIANLGGNVEGSAYNNTLYIKEEADGSKTLKVFDVNNLGADGDGGDGGDGGDEETDPCSGDTGDSGAPSFVVNNIDASFMTSDENMVKWAFTPNTSSENVSGNEVFGWKVANNPNSAEPQGVSLDGPETSEEELSRPTSAESKTYYIGVVVQITTSTGRTFRDHAWKTITVDKYNDDDDGGRQGGSGPGGGDQVFRLQ